MDWIVPSCSTNNSHSKGKCSKNANICNLQTYTRYIMRPSLLLKLVHIDFKYPPGIIIWCVQGRGGRGGGQGGNCPPNFSSSQTHWRSQCFCCVVMVSELMTELAAWWQADVCWLHRHLFQLWRLAHIFLFYCTIGNHFLSTEQPHWTQFVALIYFCSICNKCPLP